MLACNRLHHLLKRTAKTDIVCYKTLIYINETQAISPFQEYPYILGKEEHTHLKFELFPYIGVNNGFHSFCFMYDAFELCYSLYDSVNPTKLSIYECIIPKGSHYYKGVWSSDNVPALASDRLTVIRPITYNDPLEMY